MIYHRAKEQKAKLYEARLKALAGEEDEVEDKDKDKAKESGSRKEK